MSPNRGRGAFIAVLCGLVVAAGCARMATAPKSTVAGSDKVGYVRMDELIKKHPLYNQLAQYETDIQTLSLRFADQNVPRDASEVAREEADLRRQLNDAADKTQKYLHDKQIDYAQKERSAIQAALGAPAAGGAGGGAVANQVNSTYQQQAQTVASAAQKNYKAFEDAVIAEDKKASDAVGRNLAARADRSYRAKADQIAQQEADYSLKLANEDSAQRLELRTKLSNLALDDATREDTKNKLAALDRKEADALAAMRNRDQAALEAYQQRLRSQTQAQIRAEVTKIHAQTDAKLRSRQSEARSAVDAKIKSMGPQIAQTLTVGPNGKATMPPDLKARIDQIHKQYLTQYQHDYDQALAQYNRTRDELSRRFGALHGADASAQASARSHINALEKQRAALYDEIVAQIKREVKTVALAHGITVVITDVVAPAGGVDLTADAQRDIETLHE